MHALPECIARDGEMVRCRNEAKLSAASFGCPSLEMLGTKRLFPKTSDPPRVSGDDFRCQTSDAFEHVVMCLRDFHSLRPQETGWAAAIVLYEKQQGLPSYYGGV